jgi:exocyst complex component 3
MNDFQAAERKHMEEPVMDIGLEHLCALVNNNVRCYDLSKDLSENVMHSLSDYYAEQVGWSFADVIVASPS